MVLEIEFLPLLGIIANYYILDIAILRWVAYIRSLNLVLICILVKRIMWQICHPKLGFIVKRRWRCKKLV